MIYNWVVLPSEQNNATKCESIPLLHVWHFNTFKLDESVTGAAPAPSLSSPPVGAGAALPAGSVAWPGMCVLPLTVVISLVVLLVGPLPCHD